MLITKCILHVNSKKATEIKMDDVNRNHNNSGNLLSKLQTSFLEHFTEN